MARRKAKKKASREQILEGQVLPLLEGLGYRDVDFRRDVPLDALTRGELLQDSFALVVQVNGQSRILADVIEEVTPQSAERRVLMAGFLPGGAPPYALITDGINTFFFDTATRQRRSALPTRDAEVEALDRVEQERVARRAQQIQAVEDFIRVLSEVRELMHARGNYGSRNEALDDITRLLFIRMHEETNSQPGRFSREGLLSYAQQRHNGDVVVALHALFREVANEPRYQDEDGRSIFGEHPTLRLRDPSFALDVVARLSRVQTITDADLLNTAFGHFLRDPSTFQNEKEQGQYLTPQEVVDAMVDLVFARLSDEEIFSDDFTIYDPACGVSSFLIAAMRRIRQRIEAAPFHHRRKGALLERLNRQVVFGQDKSDLMVRLAKINMVVYGDGHSNVRQGNSITGDNDWNHRQHKVVFTNPPFGAEFTAEQDEETLRRFETAYTGSGNRRRLRNKQNSEVLFIEQCLKQLQPGGYLCIVVPDGILTNTNTAYVRRFIREHAVLRAVVSFPTVTFQPAGTGTKTSALFIQKQNASHTLPQGRIFMAVANNVGYEYRNKRADYSRGVPNDLVRVVEAYRETWRQYER